MGYHEALYVEPEGRVGGLSLWCKDDVQLTVTEKNGNCIETLVRK